MNTEKTRQERLRKWIDFREEERKQRLAKRNGVSIGKAVGSSLMNPAGSAAPDDSPNGEEQIQDGEKDKLTAKLELGDEIEDFKLYDCETGEEVTLDGLGGNDAEPKYPTGFEGCQVEPDDTYEQGIWYKAESVSVSFGPQQTLNSFDASFQTRRQAVNALKSQPYLSPVLMQKLDDPSFSGSSGDWTGGDPNVWTVIALNRNSCASNYDAVCDLPPPMAQWPAVDKNHLKFDKESGCFAPLCPEYNNQVLPKFQGCEEELILCDEDGKKQKVKVNEDGSIDVTQSEFNQTATIKNGKVVSVKKLTEAQKEKEFE